LACVSKRTLGKEQIKLETSSSPKLKPQNPGQNLTHKQPNMLNLPCLGSAQGLSSPRLELQELLKGKNLGDLGVEEEGVWTCREQSKNSVVNPGPEEQQVPEAKG